ncbi:serine/threonine protein kinase [Phytophthora cinnamomi]|uniref:serine/threonine protein kinase n=1 Tax=Phytophthora cinnamomi TaxID=4785 RepID=UPI003559F9D4|nr:serine/threonine protein kinase [Phytophthora cinnamomi]
MDVIETDRADVQVNSAGATSYVNNYKIMTMLGEGTFSKVYLCQNEAGNEFALKVINKSILKRKREYKRVDGKLVLSNAFQKVQREVAIMKKLAHSNLVRLYEVIDSPPDDKLFLVLELIRGGQIMYWDDKQFRYFARNTPTGVLGKDTVRDCLRDIVAALDYLHRNHVCHRDIKPENILLCRDQFKLADFGVAYMNEDALSVASSGLKLRSTEGTYHFLAPECTTGDEYDPYQVDVWALGVTMFALLLGTLPFGTSVASLSDVMTSIREDPLILPPDLDPECAELLSKLMEKNPHLRITIPQLKTHPWVSRSGGEVDRRPSGVEVMVTQQEIEAAFTPVNNFIVVMKLKMKMSSRLNNVRKSLANSPNMAPLTWDERDSLTLQLAASNAFDSMAVPAPAALPAIATGFVRKLYRILDQESAAVIAWDADGASFVVLDPDALETHVLPRYFRGRISAFRQQLKEHSFVSNEAAEQGRERYRHPLFRRGCPEQLNQITHTPLPRKRPPRRKKRKQADTEATAASTSEVKVVKSSADRGVHRVATYPPQNEPEPEFKHATVDSAELAGNPLFAQEEPPLSGFVHGLAVDSLAVHPVGPTTPLSDGLMTLKEEAMPDDVMEALLSLLSTSLSTDGREATAAANTNIAAGANSTSSTGSHNIFADGKSPVVLPAQPPGIVENGQLSDDTLNGLMRWASANGASASWT